MDWDREHVLRYLESNNFQTECIDEADEERADLLVSDHASKYVIEVKGKEASEAYRELCAAADTNGIASLERQVSYSNRLDAIIRKADSQLTNTSSQAGIFHILWVSCPEDIPFIHQQFKHTLYGQQDLTAFKQSVKSIPSILPCYYYHYSSFFRCPELDAVILSSPNSGQFCINEFSLRSRALRNSRLCSLFPEAAITDPFNLEKAGKALAIRGNIDRRDERAKWTYLLNAYGYWTAKAMEHHFTGMLSVPVPGEQ